MVVFFVLFFLAVAAYGEPLSLCLRAGINSSTVDETYYTSWGSYKETVSTDWHKGIQAIAMLDKGLSRVYHIQLGARLIQRGATYKDYQEYYKINLLYLGGFLQSAIKFSLDEGSALEFYNGPYIEARLVEKSAVSEKLFESRDFGFTTGGGIIFGKFYMGVFFDLGLTDVSKTDYFSTYNRTLGFNLGYKK